MIFGLKFCFYFCIKKIIIEIVIIQIYPVDKTLFYNCTKFESDTFNGFRSISFVRSKNVFLKKCFLKMSLMLRNVFIFWNSTLRQYVTYLELSNYAKKIFLIFFESTKVEWTLNKTRRREGWLIGFGDDIFARRREKCV